MVNKKVKKVMLFIPPVFTFKQNVDVNPMPPLGLAYLGAVLESRDIEVKIFDCLVEGWDNRVEMGDDIIRIGTPFSLVEKMIEEYKPDIVGVNSLFTTQRKNAHQICTLAKKVNGSIVTVMGGSHPTVLADLVLKDENVDFAVLGEGEETIIDLVDFIEGKKDISSLDGIGYREKDEIKIIPKTRFIEDLDKLPFPARHLLNMEKYFGLKASHGTRKKKRFSPIVTSRGCPASCTFCSAHKAWGKRFRYRSAENVIAEMKHIKDQYGIEEIMFEDDNVTLNVKRAGKLFDLMVEEKLNLVWDTPNGIAAWTLNEELIRKMKKSGCYKLNFPIETGNQYVMDNIIKKPVNLDKVKPLVSYARKIGLDLTLFFVIGMPGETEDQIWDSFRLSKEMDVYFPHISIATPYPGSELYDLCVEEKYLGDDFSLDDLFIRSFCISTENWDGEKLLNILTRGRRFLVLSFFKRHPFRFFVEFLRRLIANPLKIICKAYEYVATKS